MLNNPKSSRDKNKPKKSINYIDLMRSHQKLKRTSFFGGTNYRYGDSSRSKPKSTKNLIFSRNSSDGGLRYTKSTFNSKMRSKKTVNNMTEYNYFKEKRLLEFLTLESAKHKPWQISIQKRLENLKHKNKEYDQEKAILLRKLNSFDPVKMDGINKYLELASQNKV